MMKAACEPSGRQPRLSILAAMGLAMIASPAWAQTVTDPQIAAIVVTANQVDIDAGKLAQTKASNAEVKKFAERMVIDHTGVNKAATDLAGKLKVTPVESDTSKALKAGGDKNLERLRGLSGAAFDRAYVDHEVAYHAQVIDALDKTLIPNASNAELKALLVKSRPAFVAHLDHAKKLQASLKTGAPAPGTGHGATHRVKIAATSYQPASLTVKAGDTIVWVNEDLFPHTATSALGRFDSGKIDASATWQTVIRRRGNFSYTCTYHPSMAGEIRVR